MPFLTYLDPASTDPQDHVDREADVDWLRKSLYSFLRAPDKSRGRAVAILGERGIGKSILMQKVIGELSEELAAKTLFLVVDCRRVRTQRRVYHEIARQAVKQLGGRADVSDAMLDTARLLETIASLDTVKQTVLYERITLFKKAAKLVGKRSLLKLLGIELDINLERSIKNLDSLEGSVHFDGARLRDAVIAFFEDLREHQGYDAIIVLDNLDELDHEAIVDDNLRASLLGEIDALLGLALAPIGLVVTVRTYFASSLTRFIEGNRPLRRMSNADHIEVIRKRLTREASEIQAIFDDTASNDCIAHLAKLAPTPFALLIWFNYLAQNELQGSLEAQQSLRGLARDKFATIQPAVLERVVKAFTDPYSPIPEDTLLAACDGNRSIFKQLLRYQIVLPVDFWAPTDFTLSPDLHFMWTPPEPEPEGTS